MRWTVLAGRAFRGTWKFLASIGSLAAMARNDVQALLITPTTPKRSGNGLAMRQAVFHDALSRIAEVHTLVLPAAGPPPDKSFEAEFGRSMSSRLQAGRTRTSLSSAALLIRSNV